MGNNLYLSPSENYTFFFIQMKKGIIRFCWNECFDIAKLNNFLLQLFAFFSALQLSDWKFDVFLRGLSETWEEETKYSQKSILRFFFPWTIYGKKVFLQFWFIIQTKCLHVHDRSFFFLSSPFSTITIYFWFMIADIWTH